jgi:hypothetical protein
MGLIGINNNYFFRNFDSLKYRSEINSNNISNLYFSKFSAKSDLVEEERGAPGINLNRTIVVSNFDNQNNFNLNTAMVNNN